MACSKGASPSPMGGGRGAGIGSPPHPERHCSTEVCFLQGIPHLPALASTGLSDQDQPLPGLLCCQEEFLWLLPGYGCTICAGGVLVALPGACLSVLGFL